MLISFSSLVSKYGKPNGIIHVGAHFLEERNDYLSHGLDNTVWIEANPDVVANVLRSISLAPNERLYNCMISDTDNQDRDFYVTNNGQSSSMLALDTHKKHYPGIYVTETKKIATKRIDSLFVEQSIDPSARNFINLDIQGAELLALKGLGQIMNNIKYIYTEINIEPLYSGCCLLGELDDYLKQFGFLRVDTAMTNEKWGDAYYIR